MRVRPHPAFDEMLNLRSPFVREGIDQVEIAQSAPTGAWGVQLASENNSFSVQVSNGLGKISDLRIDLVYLNANELLNVEGKRASSPQGGITFPEEVERETDYQSNDRTNACDSQVPQPNYPNARHNVLCGAQPSF